MTPKFIIINNGLTQLRGHYYETALSIAQEAWQRGFHVVLAGHVSGPNTDLFSGLEFYPLMRLDHWGETCADEPKGLYGLRGSLKALASVSMDDVLSGRASMGDYLNARFEPLSFPAPSLVEAAPSCASAAPGEFPTPAQKAPFRTHVKAIARRLLPPLVAQPLGVLWRSRIAAKALLTRFLRAVPPVLLGARAMFTRFLRAVTPPLLLDAVQQVHRSRAPAPVLQVAAPGELTPVLALPTEPALAPPKPCERKILQCLRDELARAGAAHEAELSAIFRRDLDRLLCLVGAGPDDHVFLPTAHGREALAVRQLIHELGADQVPQFHLEFRYAVATLEDLDQGTDDPFVLRYTRIHRAFFDAFRAYPDTARVRLYTDTEELATDYANLTGEPFDVLPVPFRLELIPPAPPREESLNILFLGDVRGEKGFHLLPGLIRALREDYLEPGKVRFVLQAGIHPQEHSPVLLESLAELEKYDPAQVQLVGRKWFLTSEKYYELLAAADIVLCPYRATSFRARSSGVMAEAISAGKPTIVPADTWLARVQPSGAGETFTDEASFAEAVRLVCDNYPSYKARADAARKLWMARHSPARLFASLVETAAGPVSRAA